MSDSKTGFHTVSGTAKVKLQVRASNTAVIEFYRKLGYGIEERASMGKQLK